VVCQGCGRYLVHPGSPWEFPSLLHPLALRLNTHWSAPPVCDYNKSSDLPQNQKKRKKRKKARKIDGKKAPTQVFICPTYNFATMFWRQCFQDVWRGFANKTTEQWKIKSSGKNKLFERLEWALDALHDTQMLKSVNKFKCIYIHVYIEPFMFMNV